MQKCMQCGYEREKKDEIIDSKTCPRCGIIYDKWQPDHFRPDRSSPQRYFNNPSKEQKPTNTAFGNGFKLLKYASLTCLLLFLILIFMPGRESHIARIGQIFSSLSKSNSFEYRLEKAADDMNGRCPIMYQNIRLNSVYYETGNKITFSGTLVNTAYKDLPGYGRDYVLDKAKAHALNLIKQDERTRIFIDNKVSLTFVFKTNDEVEYGRIKIRPSDY